MAENKRYVTLRRSTGTAWEELYVASDWSQIINKPTTFTPTSHNHSTINITSGTLGYARGGTDQSSWTKGQLLYASASNTLSKLSIGSNGQVLTVNSSGLPAWVTPSGGGGSGGGQSFSYKSTDVNFPRDSYGEIIYQPGTRIVSLIYHNAGFDILTPFTIAVATINSWGMLNTPGGLIESYNNGNGLILYEDTRTYCTVVEYIWN